MYDDTGPVGGSSRFILILIVLVVIVMVATVALNGGTTQSNQEVVNNSTDNVTETNESNVQQDVIANESIGNVVKYSSYGDPTSNIRVAIIIGMDTDGNEPNSVIPTMETMNDLKYSYDIYLINSTNGTPADAPQDNSTDNQTNENSTDQNSSDQSNETVNNKTQTLASDYVVPDIENNNYNFTMDIQSTNDSNSYVYVPAEDTYTSRLVADSISNSTGIGRYTPSSYTYAKSLSIPLIENNIASMVFVSNQYSTSEVSGELTSVITAIDNFDFINLEPFSDNVDGSSDTSNDTNATNDTSNSTDDGNTTNTTNQTSTNASVDVTNNSTSNTSTQNSSNGTTSSNTTSSSNSSSQ